MSAIDLAANLVKQFEGCKLTTYPDSRGIPTIGWGHTGPEVVPGLTWTQAQADAQLTKDLWVAADGVDNCTNSHLTDQQRAALTSFAFNLGLGALKGSTLLNFVNQSQWIAAAKQFALWDHAAGAEEIGLLRRRMTEAALFLEGSHHG